MKELMPCGLPLRRLPILLRLRVSVLRRARAFADVSQAIARLDNNLTRALKGLSERACDSQ